MVALHVLAVGAAVWYSSLVHGVNALHVRSLEADFAADSNCVSVSQMVSCVHMRFVSAVGAADSYSHSVLQTLSALHTGGLSWS